VIVIPAIDVRRGRVVRLVRGRPHAETVYAEDPAEVAARFSQGGAPWIHVVDLDAALGEGDNRETLRRVVEAARCSVQVGGGLRSLEAVDRTLAEGAARVVMGTEAVLDPAFLGRAVTRFGDRVVVALDTDGTEVRIRGWTEGAGPLEAALGRLAEAGAPRFLVTAIHRDGTRLGPDVDLYRRLVPLTDRPVMASGGVGTAADLRTLAATGVEAAIVGRALYDGSLSLPEAMAAVGVSL
jgi:phosphoribosylformimino-5-aminoimidazole carboxamide ribotide isomerase